MSCNGCRVLRKGCSESCILRPCLQWIESPESQAHATLFVAKFFGRSDLMSFISAVPDHQKPAVFQSLLLEACGRTVNPVNGAVGLLWTGNWHVCQSAVNAVLCGGTLSLMPGNLTGNLPLDSDESSENFRSAWTARDSRSPSQAGYIGDLSQIPRFSKKILTERNVGGRKRFTTSANSEEQSSSMTSFEGGDENHNKLLKLFV